MSAVPRLTYSVAEVAEALGVSDQTVYRWLDDGILPEILPGSTKRRLIPRAAVDAVVDLAMANFEPRRLLDELLQEAS